MELDIQEVMAKVQQLYPVQFAHALADTRADALQRRVTELEERQLQDEAP